ncbi:MAG: porphobilinogen synthase [Rickettsiales bacterium]|nr:porphobilinogen synthase [Rickettsiales bacterium]
MNNFLSNYPLFRARRLRKEKWVRSLVCETNLEPKNLILPIFITEEKKSTDIIGMSGIKKYTVNHALEVVNKAKELGIKAIALFPEIQKNKKDILGKEALNNENLVCNAVRKIKSQIPDIGIICDVALDPYTISGHDGIVVNKKVHNDKTIELLCKQALVNVQAGCDIIAPSDMMDGRILSIRKYLEEQGFSDTIIMSYAAKFSSSLYEPFRNAISASRNLGKDKKRSYQMQYGNLEEALREVSMDIKEGADIILIKPGLPYLDVLHYVKKTFNYPTFSYQVSGEYAMIQNSIIAGTFKKEDIILEALSCFRRAGADAILTYFAIDAAQLVIKGNF